MTTTITKTIVTAQKCNDANDYDDDHHHNNHEHEFVVRHNEDDDNDVMTCFTRI